MNRKATKHYLWRIKTFKAKDLEDFPRAKQARDSWLSQRQGEIQYVEVFISNGYAVEWRPLRRVY